jgi:hypothetical protein
MVGRIRASSRTSGSSPTSLRNHLTVAQMLSSSVCRNYSNIVKFIRVNLSCLVSVLVWNVNNGGGALNSLKWLVRDSTTGVRFLAGSAIFSSSPHLGSCPDLYTVRTWALFLCVRRLENKADDLPPSSVDFMNAWHFTSITSIRQLIGFLGSKDSFIF